MHHDRRIQTPLRPLDINVTTMTQFDTRFTPPSGNPNAGISQAATGIPGGASVLMKDSAGTSMALNLDIHPVYGTPLLSGQAITAQGDVLEVHPCSCNDPIASRHNLPMTASPEPPRGGSLFREHNEPYPSPSSLSRIRQMHGPARIRTPLVLVQTQLPSPLHTTELLQELEIPVVAPGPSVNLKSPITPTPASVRRTSQTSSTGATYHTTQEYFEESSTPRTEPNSRMPSYAGPSSSQRDVPPRLNSIPTVSTFDVDLEMPAISSPSSVSVGLSGISEPSAIGPLPSLPSPSSDSAPERSPCTVLSFSRLVTDAQQNRTPTESNVNRISSRCAAYQDRSSQCVVEVTPGQPESVHGIAGARDVGIANDLDPSEHKTSSTSDLYTDRVAIRLPMPTARIGPDGEGLQYDFTAQLQPRPSLTVCFSESISWLSLIIIDVRHSTSGNRTFIIQESATAQGQNQRNMDSQSGTRPCSAQARPHPHQARPRKHIFVLTRPDVTRLVVASWRNNSPACATPATRAGA